MVLRFIFDDWKKQKRTSELIHYVLQYFTSILFDLLKSSETKNTIIDALLLAQLIIFCTIDGGMRIGMMMMI